MLELLLVRVDDTDPTILTAPFYFQAAPLETFAMETTATYNDARGLNRQYQSRPVGMELQQPNFQTLFSDYIDPNDVPMALDAYRNRVRDILAFVGDPIAIDSLGDADPFFRPAAERVEQLRDIQRALSPIRLIVARGDSGPSAAGVVSGERIDGVELDLRVTLRSVQSEERMGELETRYVTLGFSEDQQVVLRALKAKEARKMTIVDLPEGWRTMTQLATQWYGDASQWRSIQKANLPWIKSFSQSEDLWALATAPRPPSGHRGALWKILRQHKQIILPKVNAATQINPDDWVTYIGDGTGA